MNCSLCKYRSNLLGFENEVGLSQHSHHDHVNSIDHILKTNDIPIHLNTHEKKFWNKHYDNFSLHHGGDIVQLGKTNILCLHSPGHTPGSTCYYIDGNLIAGDTLFVMDVEDLTKKKKSGKILKQLMTGRTII